MSVVITTPLTATVAQRLNEALQVWNLLTGQWRRTATWVHDGGDPYAPLPGTMVWPRRCYVGTAPLVYCSWQTLQATVPSWRGDLAGGTNLPSSVQLWAPVALDLIVVWPNAAVTLTFDGLAVTPTLSGAGDYIDLNESYLDVLLEYTRHLATFKEGGQRFQATLAAWPALVVAAGDQNPDLQTTAFYQGIVNPPQPPTRGRRKLGPQRPGSEVRT